MNYKKIKKLILMLVICTPLLCSSQEVKEPIGSPFSGTYEGDRKVWVNERGELNYQRAGAPIAMKLVLIKENLYELAVPAGVRTPQGIPNIQFITDDHMKITGLELIFKDGKIDGPYSKVLN